MHLLLEGRNDPIVLEQRLHHQHIALDSIPMSLFLDVGSSYSKFMVVEISAEQTHTDLNRDDLAERLRVGLRKAVDGNPGGISLKTPQLTQTFVEDYGLSHAPKKVLDEYEDEELAAHFSRSISGLASRFYKSESRLISDVFWAFPNTKNRDFSKIQESVNRSLGGAIMGIAHVVPEAECLRLGFAKTLNALAESAKSAKHAKETAEEDNRRTHEFDERIRNAWNSYQNQPWWEKAFRTVTLNRPTDPNHSGLSYREVPTLEDWHREFSRLDCDSGLSDFLVLDAGGYSLDVYGAFSGGLARLFQKVFRQEAR